jgi:hypothetical protein
MASIRKAKLAGVVLAAALLGVACRSGDLSSRRVDADAPPPVTTGRLVEIAAAHGGFVPSTVEVEPGENLTLRFTRTTSSGCMSEVAIPQLAARRELPLHQPVDIPVTAPAEGKMLFECGMSMARGRLVVVAQAASALPTSVQSPPPAPKAHADHDPRHGGVLTMEGDYHVEIVVGDDGNVDLYVSDAVRAEIAPSMIQGTLTLESPGKKAEKQVLMLTPNAAKRSLSTKGPPPREKTEYTWDLRIGSERLLMTLAVPPGGTAKFGSASKDNRPARSIRRKIGGGDVELTLAPSGDVVGALYDADGKRAPVRDAKATVRVGSKETVLAYDAASDTLRGRIELPNGDHVDAVVTVTLPGGRATPLHVTFHLKAKH